MSEEERVTCGSLAGTTDRDGAPCDGCEFIDGVWRNVMYQCMANKHGHRAYCEECGAEVSIDPDGQPTSRRMVPEAALAWVGQDAFGDWVSVEEMREWVAGILASSAAAEGAD